MHASHRLAALASRLGYPSIVAAAMTLATLLQGRGASPATTTTVAFLATLALTVTLERRWPHRATWTPTPEEARQDLAYLGLAALLQPVARALAGLVASLATVTLVGWLAPGAPPSGGPAWARIVVALALADLGKYGLHRLAHETTWLWPYHAEHHAPTRLHALNGVRLHPVNLLWNLVLDAAAPLALGLDARSAALLATFRGAVSILQHANVALRPGLLSWVLSTPDLHRWHHATDLRDANTNYGSTLIVWDVLFGTRRLPSDAGPTTLGLADPGPVAHPTGLLRQLVWPVCATKTTCNWHPTR
jgi:sterol desaturase/sphingolipid hydroxylase (fatty acid hydroxylase superfamily)